MIAIFKREIQSYFTLPLAYLSFGLFILLNGFFLWVINRDLKIFEDTFSGLSKFFSLVPWALLFLIPAVTMKTFAQEKKQGTLALLLTKPISLWDIVLGKFLATFTLALIALAPTLLYSYSLVQVGTSTEIHNIGPVAQSYLGIIFLIACFTSAGLFASMLSTNKIAVFFIAFALCFALHYGPESIAALFSDIEISTFLQKFGMQSHFKSSTHKGLYTQDLVYFIAVPIFFLLLTGLRLKNQQRS